MHTKKNGINIKLSIQFFNLKYLGYTDPDGTYKKGGDIEEVKRLLAQGCHPAFKNKEGMSCVLEVFQKQKNSRSEKSNFKKREKLQAWVHPMEHL